MVTQLTHPHYDRRRRDWLLVRRMYRGEDVEKELVKRYHEHPEHFEQRKKDADFTPHTRHLLSRLVGMLFQRREDVARTMPEKTKAALPSIGPDGEDYAVQLMSFAEMLLAYDEAWLVYNPRRGLEPVSPLQVPVWTDTDVVVKGSRNKVDLDAGVAGSQETYTRYGPRGYRTFVRDTEENEDVRIDAGVWAANEDGESSAFFVDPNGRPSAPVFRVEMPWASRFGYLLARKHKALFNAVSRTDFSFSVSANGWMQMGIGESEGDDQLAEQLKEAFSESHVLPYMKNKGEHKGVSIPTDPAELGLKIQDRKLKKLREAAFKELEKATRKTATEAQFQHSAGPAAALAVLALTMADAESRALHFISQGKDFTLAGPTPSNTGVSVTWPSDYTDVLGTGEIIDRVFPGGIPLDAETATNVVIDYLENKGVDYNESAIRSVIQSRLDADAQAASASSFNV